MRGAALMIHRVTFVLTLVVASPALARHSSRAVFLGTDPLAVRDVKLKRD